MRSSSIAGTEGIPILATIIMDTYRKDEAAEIAEALDDTCSPDDTYGFSSAAIYCYWSIKPREILYIGLARNVLNRFRQHAGLIKCDPKGCKREQIDDFFKTHDRIGYSILVQSAMEQPMAKGDEKELADLYDDAFVVEAKQVFEGEENIKFGEGLLIDLHERLGDKKPRWNKVHGVKRGRGAAAFTSLAQKLEMVVGLVAGKTEEEIHAEMDAKGPPYEYLERLDGSVLSDFNAKCTLREISADPTFCSNEEFLHAVRMMMLGTNMSFDSALEVLLKMNPYATGRVELMQETGYLDRKLQLPGVDLAG